MLLPRRSRHSASILRKLMLPMCERELRTPCRRTSPLVRNWLRAYAIDAVRIVFDGRSDRLSKDDVQQFIEEEGSTILRNPTARNQWSDCMSSIFPYIRISRLTRDISHTDRETYARDPSLVYEVFHSRSQLDSSLTSRAACAARPLASMRCCAEPIPSR